MASSLTLTLPDERATQALAARLAVQARRGDVIALAGPLGAGKTSFARGFIRARCGLAEVPSPTFTLVEIYGAAPQIWHFDLFRIETPEEAWELGIEEAFSEGISLVEWPERLGALLPSAHLAIGFVFGATADERRLTFAGAAWSGRLAGLAHG